MRNKFTIILTAATIALVGFFATFNLDAAPRKVVIEDHTGAWCGYCPRGMETLQKLEAQYGESIIGVGVHNGDAMTIASYQTPLSNLVGVAGYPNGTVNRVTYNGKIAQSDNAWTPITNSIVNTEVPVGVTLDVDYDKVTGEYTATITAVVESEMNAQLAFNLWAIEDYMKGTGNQWDQSNYLSSQSSVAPTPSSKFYNQPASIVGFEHNNVFRGATSGLEGDTDGFPTSGTTPAGTYTKVYSGNVSDLNVENKFNAYFVAVVHNRNNKEIVNADRVGKPDYTNEASAPTISISASNQYSLVPENETSTHYIDVTSTLNSEAVHGISILPTSFIPDGWEIDVNSVTLPANGSGQYEVTVNPNGNAGFAYIIVRAFAQVPNSKNWVSQSAFFSLSATTERMHFGSADRYSGYTQGDLNASPIYQNAGRSLISPAQLEILEPNITNMLKTVIFTVDELTTGMAAQVSSANLTTLKKFMDNGTNLLIAAPADVKIYGNLISSFPPTAAATDFFKNTIGVDFGINVALKQGQQYIAIPITGVNGDPISNGISTSANTQGSYRGINELPSLSLNGNTSATAFLEAPSTTPYTTQNNKLAVKLDNSTNGQRTILMSIPIDVINTGAQATLVNNMVTWLEGGTVQGAGPSISLNVEEVKFGEIEVDETVSELVQLSNKGDEPLIISEINFLKGTNFTVKAGTLPLTVDPGQTINVTVEFTPTAKQNYTDEITFVTNDSENPQKVLDVQGIGKLITSVPGEILNVFSMNVTPNPVEDNSVIRFNVKEGSSNVNIELIDATGKVVSNLFNAVTSSTQSVDLNASQLSSGSYYINANVDGKTTQLPVVITK